MVLPSSTAKRHQQKNQYNDTPTLCFMLNFTPPTLHPKKPTKGARTVASKFPSVHCTEIESSGFHVVVTLLLMLPRLRSREYERPKSLFLAVVAARVGTIWLRFSLPKTCARVNFRRRASILKEVFRNEYPAVASVTLLCRSYCGFTLRLPGMPSGVSMLALAITLSRVRNLECKSERADIRINLPQRSCLHSFRVPRVSYVGREQQKHQIIKIFHSN